MKKSLLFASLAAMTFCGVGCGRTGEYVSVDEPSSTVPNSTMSVTGTVKQEKILTDISTTTPAPIVPPVTSPVAKRQNYSQSFSMNIDISKMYSVVLHTEKGDITIALTAAATPKTVNNFVSLARDHFYDGTIFHRVIDGFMIQGGDPKGDGTGGPGYKFDDESFAGSYDRGVVAMANAGPNTNGSQFFIMHASVPLPKNYVIFGKVLSGMEVVDAIATAPVQMSASGESSQPVMPVKVKGVTVVEK